MIQPKRHNLRRRVDTTMDIIALFFYEIRENDVNDVKRENQGLPFSPPPLNANFTMDNHVNVDSKCRQ